MKKLLLLALIAVAREATAEDAKCVREHAAIAPRHLGLRAVVAVSYARIHWQNLANFGIVALEFADAADYQRIDTGDQLRIGHLPDALRSGEPIPVHNITKNTTIATRHRLSDRQIDAVIAGGQIPLAAVHHTADPDTGRDGAARPQSSR